MYTFVLGDEKFKEHWLMENLLVTRLITLTLMILLLIILVQIIHLIYNKAAGQW